MKEIVKFIKEGLKITSKTKVVKYNYHPKTKKELKKVLFNFTNEIENILEEGLEFDNSIEGDYAEAFLSNLQAEIWKKGIAPLL